MLRAVILDFDGVITDSEILHFRSFNEILAPLGAELTTHDYYKSYLGFSDFDCFSVLIRQGILKIDKSRVPDLVRQKHVVFKKLAATEGRLFEGVRDFLEMLSQNNIPMAICSGALLAEIELVLEEARLRRFFETIVSAEQFKKSKPDPEGFVLTLQKLNENRTDPIAPANCVVIEDSRWGVEAAKAAGMHTIAVTNSYAADQFAAADKTVARLNEITLETLRRLCD